MIASLISRGASRDVAEDVVSEILAECVTESPRNLLARFKGEGPPDGWLIRVAINRLISLQRREKMMEPAEDGKMEFLPCERMEVMEEALKAIVSKALRDAIESLPAESRLLLWLRHGYGISQNRLCTCWRSTPSKLSRALSSARRIVRDQTLRSIQTKDPGLHLQWQDISGVCSNSLLFSETHHVV
jgi:RNA polymerase sigma factor (sigma-70 family)